MAKLTIDGGVKAAYQKRDNLIGIRFTRSEKDYFERVAKDNNMTVTDLIRMALNTFDKEHITREL